MGHRTNHWSALYSLPQILLSTFLSLTDVHYLQNIDVASTINCVRALHAIFHGTLSEAFFRSVNIRCIIFFSEHLTCSHVTVNVKLLSPSSPWTEKHLCPVSLKMGISLIKHIAFQSTLPNTFLYVIWQKSLFIFQTATGTPQTNATTNGVSNNASTGGSSNERTLEPHPHLDEDHYDEEMDGNQWHLLILSSKRTDNYLHTLHYIFNCNCSSTEMF